MAVGSDTEIGIETLSRCDDPSPVAECLETRAAVISAHAAVPDATEREVAVGGLQDCVVDAGSARRCVLYHIACPFAATGKVVECQRFFPLVYIFYTVVDVVKRYHGKYGPEDFVAEQGRLRVDVGEQSGGDVSVGRVVSTTQQCGAVRKESRQTFEMAFVDDAGVLGVELRVFAILT